MLKLEYREQWFTVVYFRISIIENQLRDFLLPGLVFLLAITGVSRFRFSQPLDNEPPGIRVLETNFLALKNQMDRGDFRGTLSQAKSFSAQAAAFDRPDLQLQALRVEGAAQLGNRQVRQSLITLRKAHVLATGLRNSLALYAIDNNLSWIEMQMDNAEAAAPYADEALAASRASGRYDARLVSLRALIYAKTGDFPSAERLFSEVISRSMELKDSNDCKNLALAAKSWNFLGGEYYKAGRFAQSEIAQTESFRLRRIFRLSEIEVSERDLARSLAARGDLRTSSVLMDEALEKLDDPESTEPLYLFYRERARLRTMKNDFAGALADLRTALDLARRLDVIPTDDDRVTFESGLEELYSLFIDTANRLYLLNGDERLKEESFAVAEEDRAASLRALVPHPNGWRTRLPAEYGTLLERLQDAERAQLSNISSGDQDISTLRERLTEMETQAGAPERNDVAAPLARARDALDGDSALLAFHLSPRASWLWTVTPTRFELHQLGPKTALSVEAARFREAIENRSPAARRLGAELSAHLIGSVGPEIEACTRWIVALDKDLFDLPLAALPRGGHYLVEDHSLLVTPGVPMMRRAAAFSPIAGSLEAVGDPIYNRADSRWTAARPFFSTFFSPLHAYAGGPAFARLSGSATEVRQAVAIWGSGSVLEGAAVTKPNLEAALAKKPAILHLATHVIPSPRWKSGVIVLGLKPDGVPDYLDVHDIVFHPVNTRLIVMTGCASGSAQSLPAAGLMGLTRAWLGAGAAEVLATRWPTLDDTGPFITTFYRHLKANSGRGATAALRDAQIEMIRSTGFRNSPDYWADYFLIGKP